MLYEVITLTVIDVADRPDVDVRLVPLELLLRHQPSSIDDLEPTTRLELVTSSLPRTRSTD